MNDSPQFNPCGFVLQNMGSYGHTHVIVVSDGAGNYLLTNWTTLKDISRCDAACILHAGEHPALKHDSYMYYAGSQCVSAEWLAERIRDGNFRIMERLQDDVYARVVEGAQRSRFLKTLYKKQFHLA